MKVSVGRDHALVLAQDIKGEENLYSIGQANLKYLGCTEEGAKEVIRKIPMLASHKIVDFSAGPEYNMVIIEGSKNLTDGLYEHTLPEGKTATGLLHAYYQDGKWQFMSQEDYESTNGKDLPDICLAFKCPIPDLERVINREESLLKIDLKSLLNNEESKIKNVFSSHS